MPRPLRVHLPGAFYHATLRGNHQQDIFVAPDDRRLLNRIAARAFGKFGARLHAYCWMSNHLHFLVRVDTQPLSNPMRNIAAEFARAMQSKLATTGHFFERRFHASLVDSDAYLMELVRYVHLNPVRAGIVDRPDAFPWSSHHAYVGRRNEPWVETDFVLRLFGQSRSTAILAYTRFLLAADALEWNPEPAIVGKSRELGAFERWSRTEDFLKTRKTAENLEQLIEEACDRFAIQRARLNSPLRDRYAMQVRAWIANQASSRHIAGLSAVARALSRDESTLRHALRVYAKEIE
jgi:putative transposase